MEAKKLGSQNNHRYFPEFMIRAFYGKKPVEYLNAKNGQIIQGQKSKNYNTMLGWYSDENEAAINKEAEQQFQQLSATINKMVRSGNRDFSNLKFNHEIIYRFFAYQILRDPASASSLLDKLMARDGIKSTEKLSLQDFQNGAINIERANHIVTDSLEELFKVVLEPNYTNIDYVAINVPVMMEFLDGKMYILVVAPKLAACLVSRELFNKLNLGTIRDDDVACVATTNERIMAHAITHEPHEVLGRNPQQLTKLWSDTGKKIIA